MSPEGLSQQLSPFEELLRMGLRVSEAKLVITLCREPSRTFTKEELNKEIHAGNPKGKDTSIYAVVCRAKKIIGKNAIHSVMPVGYTLGDTDLLGKLGIEKPSAPSRN